MTWPVTLEPGRIDLHVEGRIDAKDAQRQQATAQELLRRLAHQPGIVLADEVGMGKTFVALAVALETAWADEKQRPVVVMMPASLRDKWPRDYKVFLKHCVKRASDRDMKCAEATNGLEFFRLLDQTRMQRPRILFLTHGALSRNLDDPWVKFAILKRAMRGKHLGVRRSALPRFASRILLVSTRYKDDELFEQLLRTDTGNWNDIIAQFGDPLDHRAVPIAIADVLEQERIDLGDLAARLRDLPVRATDTIDERLLHVRRSLNHAFREIWKAALQQARFRSPLVILDEAHHVKNPTTELASLFVSPEADEDARELGGTLAGGFERMLFLTATPFQLGHSELLHVLDRFRGIHWKTLPAMTQEQFEAKHARLGTALDQAQRTALDLDNHWQRLHRDDLPQRHAEEMNLDGWWRDVSRDPKAAPGRVQECHRTYLRAKEALSAAEDLLRPWVVRHVRDRTLPNSIVARRQRIIGQGICDRDPNATNGLPMRDSGLLPFLLAARAQSMVAHSARGNRGSQRATFAEGLASSYEAFLETRRSREGLVDEAPDHEANDDPRVLAYVERLMRALPDQSAYADHPKVGPVVEHVAKLWEAGEKVVVFCHYRVTGRVLVRHISAAIARRLAAMAQRKSGGDDLATPKLLGSWSSAFDKGAPLYRTLHTQIQAMLPPVRLSGDERSQIFEVARRFVRTRSFLVRYLDLTAADRTEALEQALLHPDGSGASLREKLEAFVAFMVERCTPDERAEYLEALGTIQPGGSDYLAPDGEEGTAGHAEVLPNVRLANGTVRSEIRRRLLLGFNTPFLPEILVASSVMAEGVDLHLNCRHIVHHDLAWNPSTIEQRTGRIDRIGAKAERVGKSIEVALPYVAGTQDEKMFRVVMDRERWFHVVMGERFATDESSTDRTAERVPLPESIAKELTMRLEIVR